MVVPYPATRTSSLIMMHPFRDGRTDRQYRKINKVLYKSGFIKVIPAVLNALVSFLFLVAGV